MDVKTCPLDCGCDCGRCTEQTHVGRRTQSWGPHSETCPSGSPRYILFENTSRSGVYFSSDLSVVNRLTEENQTLRAQLAAVSDLINRCKVSGSPADVGALVSILLLHQPERTAL